MNFTNRVEGKYEELGPEEMVGIESWQKFRNSKFQELGQTKIKTLPLCKGRDSIEKYQRMEIPPTTHVFGSIESDITITE